MQADTRGPRDYEDHLYVNTQGLDGPESLQPEDSPKKDLFDMRKWGQAGLWGGATPEQPVVWWGMGCVLCFPWDSLLCETLRFPEGNPDSPPWGPQFDRRG